MSDQSSEPTTTPEDPAPQQKMQYLRSYQFIFEREDWLTNLLLCSVCFLIPVIGPLILMGYQYEVIENLHRRPGEKMVKFDFGRFSELLSRGVYPFVVSLIFTIVTLPFSMLFGFLMVGLPRFAAEGDLGIAMLIIMPCLVIGSIVIGIFMSLVMGPLLLRAGLSQSLRGVFSFKWVCSFIGHMWKEELVATFFLMFTGSLLAMVGILFCFIGLYPASALNMLAAAHLAYQQYEIFLAQGGEPIPLKDIPEAPVALSESI